MSYKEDLESAADGADILGLRAFLSNIGDLADKEIAKLEEEIAKKNKLINYCIGQIHDSSKLKYIGTLLRDMDN